ncbi:NifB/NifX family molybdenum-iron cluster-binding protein [Anaerophaga thermohalophila]|uniref:NifB/NifX family molybdenum-iron cluster-binding protein n=1 Tax=Anaerophaga thermohalophila TaxID=177400 RepID=UPI0002ED5647|nr:NifB/NifX family molybdenum-iron cluster-binding protein [Anaerophaga thermohalophila]
MDQEKIRFAFALGTNEQFEPKHFGEAEKYAIYEWSDCNLNFITSIPNPMKDLNEEQLHGSRLKGTGIINLLKKEEVNVVVSKQFGKNIKMINQHFVPVIINVNNPSEAYRFLKNHIQWIRNELLKNGSGYELLI